MRVLPCRQTIDDSPEHLWRVRDRLDLAGLVQERGHAPMPCQNALQLPEAREDRIRRRVTLQKHREVFLQQESPRQLQPDHSGQPARHEGFAAVRDQRKATRLTEELRAQLRGARRRGVLLGEPSGGHPDGVVLGDELDAQRGGADLAQGVRAHSDDFRLGPVHALLPVRPRVGVEAALCGCTPLAVLHHRLAEGLHQAADLELPEAGWVGRHLPDHVQVGLEELDRYGALAALELLRREAGDQLEEEAALGPKHAELPGRLRVLRCRRLDNGHAPGARLALAADAEDGPPP
mmetsp:Transcript_5765/g.13999  ORF Transcript_5765/g.13999 Transcript_5765/m.13999 type:complete len:292 (+) Transcript_5765:615-1490(+)